MAPPVFGDSHEKNKSAVRTLPIDFFGSEYFEPNPNLPNLTAEECARGRESRLEARRRLLGF